MPVCVECGAAVESVYKEFSKGNIRLTRCEACGKLADKYVEFELILLVLDLLLHKTQVYRHILFNRIAKHSTIWWGIDKSIAQLIPAYLFFDAYLYWSRISSDRMLLLVTSVAMSYLVFCAGVFLIVWALSTRYGIVFREGKFSYSYLLMAIILSSFGKLSTILLMIWNYDINFGKVVNIYVFASNITAITVYLECSSALSFIIVAFGIIVRSVFHLIFYATFPSMGLFIF
jgi:hypothetical protein